MLVLSGALNPHVLHLPKLGIIIPGMGIDRSTETGLAGALFSRVQLRLLGLLFGHPDRAYHASELIRLAGSGSGAVQRELKKIADAGIVVVTASANRKLYRANRQSPIFKELRGLIVKTVGLVEPLRNSLKKFEPRIEAAFVYGSVAKGADTAKSDIDIMIIGDDLGYAEVYAALQKAEAFLQRSVSPNVMSPKEWRQKVARKNPFATKILMQPKLFLFGTKNALEGTG
jgi:predicted nucleotidyltransferase